MMLPDPRTSAQIRQLIEQLAVIASDREQARALARAAGFPTSYLPEFKTPIEFWSAVVEQASHGRMSLDALIDEAIAQFPHNPGLLSYRVVTDDPPDQDLDAHISAPSPVSSTTLHGVTPGPARDDRGSPRWRDGLAYMMLGVVLGTSLGGGVVWSLQPQEATKQAVQGAPPTAEDGAEAEPAPPTSCSPLPTAPSNSCAACRHRIGVGAVQRCIKTLTFLESNSKFIKRDDEWRTNLDKLVSECAMVVKALDGP